MKMKKETKEILKIAGAGLVGAITPMYTFSLLTADFDPVEALKLDGLLYATRGALALLGALPGINKIPFINEAYKLFAPEYYGFVGGIAVVAVGDTMKEQKRLEKESQSKLENTIQGDKK